MNNSLYLVFIIYSLVITKCYSFKLKSIKVNNRCLTDRVESNQPLKNCVLPPSHQLHYFGMQTNLKKTILFNSEAIDQIDPTLENMNINNGKLSPTSNLNFIQKIINLLSGKGFDGKVTFSSKDLAKLGLNVLLAYGFVSNISYMTSIIIAWCIHGKRTGLSPLATGQWKNFLAVYVGLFAANNIIRPLRFSLSLLLSPSFEKFVDIIQQRTKWNRASSIGLLVFLVNVCGTISYVVGGLFLTTKLLNVPLLPK